MKDKIISAANSPHNLEILYRENPKEFAHAFRDAFVEQHDSAIMQVWNERLFFKEPEGESEISTSRWRPRDIWVAIALSLIAGTLAKIPHFFSKVDDELFYSRNLGCIVAGALIAFFCIQKMCKRSLVGTMVALLIGATAYLNLLPDRSNSQTIILSCIHMPFFFWSLLGVAFLGGAWRDLKGRMSYVRYNGELLIYSTGIVIGGKVPTGLNFALFGLIDLSIEEWYIKNVVVYGSIASPIVATLLIDRIVSDRFKIAPLLAKVFTPLFLLTVLVYLMAMILNQKSPFTDRDFLISFNGLLLIVLGLCVFSISERGSREMAGVVDFMNIGLVSVTLAIDVIALAAILFRLTSYGFTPNRVAVLGANLLAFGHLAGILWHYVGFIRSKSDLDHLDRWIVRYIPAYTTWTLVVAVGLPLVFWFK